MNEVIETKNIIYFHMSIDIGADIVYTYRRMASEAQLQRENAELRAALDSLEIARASLEAELEGMVEQNKILQAKVDALIRRIFGSKSERFIDPNQKLFDFGEDTDSSKKKKEEPDEKPKSGKGSRSKPERRQRRIITPENIKVVEEILIPEEVQQNPDQWKEIGRETLEQLDFKPGEFTKRIIIRPKFVHIDEREKPPIIVPAPPQIIDRCRATVGLLVQIIVARFVDHLPYYRQTQIFLLRYGVRIPRQLMSQWARDIAFQLQILYEEMKEEVRDASYIQIDETFIKYLDPNNPENPKGSGQGNFFTLTIPGQLVIYQWSTSRSASSIEEFLGGRFKGVAQTDGYAGYATLFGDDPEITHVGCWAHTRRKFQEALDDSPVMAGWILNQIRRLYAWDRELGDAKACPKLRQIHRCAHAAMVIQRLRRVIEMIQPRYLRQSPMGKACAYALGQWPLLVRVLDHGVAELDTNLVENSIRPTAVGKKNWLFIGAKEAGQTSAILYSIVQTCRVLGIKPIEYLTDVLKRLPSMTASQARELTPLKWAQARGIRPVCKAPSTQIQTTAA